MLISAYDVHYKHLPRPGLFPCKPALTIVDSGGYETGAGDDLSAVYRMNHSTQPWTEKKYVAVLDKWPSYRPAVFVSFDTTAVGRPVQQQIAGARKLLRRYDDQLHCLLLKPTRKAKGRIANVLDELRQHAAELGAFHVIGVTEKDLGSSMLERLLTTLRLRRLLEETSIELPIQVFGALDPVSSTLYMMAGADICDGLTWLRFAFVEDRCIYIQNYGTLQVGIHASDDSVHAKLMFDNYSALRKLELGLQTLATTGDYSTLGPELARLQGIEKTLMAKASGGA